MLIPGGSSALASPGNSQVRWFAGRRSARNSPCKSSPLWCALSMAAGICRPPRIIVLTADSPIDEDSYYENTTWCNRDLIPIPPERRTWDVWGYFGMNGTYLHKTSSGSRLRELSRLLDCFRVLHICLADGKHAVILRVEPERCNRMCCQFFVSPLLFTQ